MQKKATTSILIGLILFTSNTLYSQTNTNYGTYAGNSGTNNTSIGYYASDVVTGANNSTLGANAGKVTTTGYDNVFLGSSSGVSNTTGFRNSFIGFMSGFSNSSGTYNTYLGYKAGCWNTTSSYNTLIGFETGLNSTGEKNVFLGSQSGRNNTGSSSVFIGYQSGYSETGSNKLYIANSNTTTPLVYGEFNNSLFAINGRQGIGTVNVPDSIALKVNGTIMAKKVIITLDNFPDYVFEKDYPLMSLPDLKSFIEKNKHLPGIPSEKEAVANGIDVAGVNTKLLEKVEELTLYVIQLEEKMAEMNERLDNINKGTGEGAKR
jgi:hypothetical protein